MIGSFFSLQGRGTSPIVCSPIPRLWFQSAKHLAALPRRAELESGREEERYEKPHEPSVLENIDQVRDEQSSCNGEDGKDELDDDLQQKVPFRGLGFLGGVSTEQDSVDVVSDRVHHKRIGRRHVDGGEQN